MNEYTRPGIPDGCAGSLDNCAIDGCAGMKLVTYSEVTYGPGPQVIKTFGSLCSRLQVAMPDGRVYGRKPSETSANLETPSV
jgi:hypothetical protein